MSISDSTPSAQRISSQRPRHSLANLRKRLIAEHAAVAGALTTALSHAMNAGDVLIEAKAQPQLDHGDWIPWLESCGISPRLAQMYARLARHRSIIEAKAKSVSHLTVTGALALLANPKKEPQSVDLLRYTLDPLRTHRAELEFAIGLVRGVFPDESDDDLLRRAADWRHTAYRQGKWPTAAELLEHEENLKRKAATLAKKQEAAAKRQATMAAKQARIKEQQAAAERQKAKLRRIAAAETLARDQSTTEHERQAAREAAAKLKTTPPPSHGLPRTLAEWDALKQKASAERKARRAGKGVERISLADLREAQA
ncbi:MAG: DUF3102 domain-containing protein [Xanthobacteraceae bacterium]